MTTFADLVGNILGLVNVVIPLLVSVAVAVFFYGLARYVYQTGDAHGHAQGKDLIVWGLIAIFVLVSVWGIIAFMRESLNL